MAIGISTLHIYTFLNSYARAVNALVYIKFICKGDRIKNDFMLSEKKRFLKSI